MPRWRYAEAVYAGHLDLTQPLVWTVEDAMSRADCDAYIRRFHAGCAEVAPIVGRHGSAEIDLEVRNNTRVMWDDPTEADALLARVARTVPTSSTVHSRLRRRAEECAGVRQISDRSPPSSCTVHRHRRSPVSPHVGTISTSARMVLI